MTEFSAALYNPCATGYTILLELELQRDSGNKYASFRICYFYFHHIGKNFKLRIYYGLYMILGRICFWNTFNKKVLTFVTNTILAFFFLFRSVNVEIFIIFIFSCFSTMFFILFIAHIKTSINISIKVFHIF